MRGALATVALLVVAVPALAGAAAWSGCALPAPPSCCCGDDGEACGCGCGAGQAPARAPEPPAMSPQAPEPGPITAATATAAPVSDVTRPLGAGRQDRSELPATDLLLSGCTFRC